jgi:hypothetical protein
VNTDAINHHRLVGRDFEIRLSVHIRRVYMHVVTPPRKAGSQSVDRTDRAAIANGRIVGGDHVKYP